MNSKTKVFLITCTVVVLFLSVSTAYGKEKAGMGYFLGGVGLVFESDNNSVIYSLGGGGHSIKNRLILGGEGHSCFGPGNAGGYGFFNIGYAIVSSDKLILYPLLGVGGGALTRDTKPSVSKCALLNPSLRLDYLIHIKDKSGVLLGLHAGYTFTLYSNTFKWSMPYIRLAIGGFGIGD